MSTAMTYPVETSKIVSWIFTAGQKLKTVGNFLKFINTYANMSDHVDSKK